MDFYDIASYVIMALSVLGILSVPVHSFMLNRKYLVKHQNITYEDRVRMHHCYVAAVTGIMCLGIMYLIHITSTI